jgi:hypothetical protein
VTIYVECTSLSNQVKWNFFRSVDDRSVHTRLKLCPLDTTVPCIIIFILLSIAYTLPLRIVPAPLARIALLRYTGRYHNYITYTIILDVFIIQRIISSYVYHHLMINMINNMINNMGNHSRKCA